MGAPEHYSQDLPDRCYQLITKLWDTVQVTFNDGEEHLGPMTTTFLLAMANPIIVLPIERIERHRGKEIAGYVNDRPLDHHLALEIDRVLGAPRFSHCPFFEPGQWRFTTVPFKHQNFALRFPDDARDALDRQEALERAAQLQASEWAACLRNALAHGGVSYLDGDGYARQGVPVEMLAFVSATYPKHPIGHPLAGYRDTSKPPVELKVLRITEAGFFRFLGRWVDWLKASGLSSSLARAA